MSVTTRQVQQMTAFAQAGTPTAEIARRHGVDPTTVRHYLRIAAIAQEDVDDAVDRYTAGAPLIAIARRLHTDNQIARQLLVDQGLAIRPPCRPRRDGTPPRRRTPTPGGTMPARRDLTEHELQVLTLACDHDVASIARRLDLGESTVRKQLTRIRGALGARTTAHAIALAFRAGILT